MATTAQSLLSWLQAAELTRLGFRTALVFSVGVATIATFINAGGLGEVIVVGLKLTRPAVLLTGAIVVSCIALLLDWLAGLAEDALRPKGV